MPRVHHPSVFHSPQLQRDYDSCPSQPVHPDRSLVASSTSRNIPARIHKDGHCARNVGFRVLRRQSVPVEYPLGHSLSSVIVPHVISSLFNDSIPFHASTRSPWHESTAVFSVRSPPLILVDPALYRLGRMRGGPITKVLMTILGERHSSLNSSHAKSSR